MRENAFEFLFRYPLAHKLSFDVASRFLVYASRMENWNSRKICNGSRLKRMNKNSFLHFFLLEKYIFHIITYIFLTFRLI